MSTKLDFLIKVTKMVVLHRKLGNLVRNIEKTDIFKIAAIQYLEFGSENVIKKDVYNLFSTFWYFS